MMPKLTDYDSIKSTLDSCGGVLTVEMYELRDINGSGRLGPYVVEAISKQLAARGVGHFPEELPQIQWHKVRLFGLGGEISELYKLLADISEEGDEKLKEFTNDSAKEKIDRIRQIVC